MTLISYDVEQGAEDWDNLRRGMVTASTISGLLTSTLKVADNETSRGLTRRLVAERITGTTDPSPMTDDMWRGHTLEPYARDTYSGHYQQAVECGFMVLEEDGWQLGASPDGLIGYDGGLELKAPRPKTHLRWILEDRVPPQHMAQCQAALLVTGRHFWDFMSFVSGQPIFVKRVTPDPAWFDAIRAAASTFEQNAIAMVADYRSRVAELPVAPHVNTDPELVI